MSINRLRRERGKETEKARQTQERRDEREDLGGEERERFPKEGEKDARKEKDSWGKGRGDEKSVRDMGYRKENGTEPSEWRGQYPAL